MAEWIIGGIALAVGIGGSIYQADAARRQNNQAIDAQRERAAQIAAENEAARKLAEQQRKEAEQSVEIGQFDIGEEDTAAVRRSKALGKSQFIIENEAQKTENEDRLQLGTSAPAASTSGVQV